MDPEELAGQLQSQKMRIHQLERALEVEEALEKVRSRTMAMHQSDEMLDTAKILFHQLEYLGIALEVCGFSILEKEVPRGKQFLSIRGTLFPEPLTFEFDKDDQLQKVYNAWVEQQPTMVLDIEGEELKQHMTNMKQLVKELSSVEVLVGTAEEIAKDDDPSGRLLVYHAFFNHGYLFLTNTQPVEEMGILVRFARVFEQTYTRFLDLQKAEAQTREVQIEAALERVRARSMAMYKADELAEVSMVLFDQVQLLGIKLRSCGFLIMNEAKKNMEDWSANLDEHGGFTMVVGTLSYNQHPILADVVATWRRGDPYFIGSIHGDALQQYYQAVTNQESTSQEIQKNVLAHAKSEYTNSFNFEFGMMYVLTSSPLHEDQIELFLRFANVFRLTYRRFLDLKRAEAQAREAHIETALERVRSASMAMHESEELIDVATIMYEEIQKLGFTQSVHCTFALIDEEKKQQIMWGSRTDSKLLEKFILPLFGDQVLQDRYDAWKSKKPLFSQNLNTKQLNEHLALVMPDSTLTERERESKTALPETTHIYYGNFSHGYLQIISSDLLSDEQGSILVRFAKVFEQTYTRFLDLEKAEAQAREAQIEAALERVRSRTMAMHHSEELGDVASVLYQQLIGLGISGFFNCGFIIVKENEGEQYGWLTQPEGNFEEKINLPYPGDDVLKNRLDAWKKQVPVYHQRVGGQALKKHLKYVAECSHSQHQVETFMPFMPDPTYFYCGNFSEGYLHIITKEKLGDETVSILARFTKVFEQTYTRFLDLQKAEAQAREAQIEAALERVRSQTMAMQKADELHEVVTLIVEKLMDLGVILDANGVILCTYFKDSRDVLHWIASPDFSFTGSYLLPYFDHPIFRAAWESRLSGVDYFSQSFPVEEKNSFFEYAFEHSDYKNFPDEFKNWVFQNDKHSLSFAWSENSAILIPSHTGVVPSEEDVEILKRFAKVFEQAYVRFQDLQKAEEQANLIKEERDRLEVTLQELKSTQSQLIQAEKMASLGELTAGIAHEIQNPLNFVNNFSEVSSELIEEAKEELEKGDISEAKELISELVQNLEKISHHGRRASSIVRGMLDHSRTSSGEKVLIDINNLCDEYLRLAYHGMRAKDKSFNAKLKLDLDPDLPKVNVVPQDIGRVLLNLVNNAFYATQSKLSDLAEPSSAANLTVLRGYKPLVSVSTKLSPLRGQVTAGQSLKATDGVDSSGSTFIEITISDNGPGIPENIRDKIFQPFFTTKPTGQGTGLGLSLSYDIIKAHGGELKFESTPGEGTVFIIHLPFHK